MQLTPAFPAWWRWLLLALMATLPHLPVSCLATAPANDTCAGAVDVPGSGPFPHLTAIVDMSEATNVGDPPLPPPSTFFDTNVTRSVWYRFVPTASGLYTLSVGADTATATNITDTSMVVYESTAGCAGVNQVLTYNEDSGLLLSALTNNFVAGHEYYIVVWVGPIESATNNLKLQLRVSKPFIPSNDDCSGAEIIPASIPASGYLTAETDTTLATENLEPPSCAPTDLDRLPSRDVWYRFIPGVSGTYIFSTKINETRTTVEDTMIAIYTSANGCAGPFTEVAGGCNNNDVSRASLPQNVTAGTPYYIVLWDNSPDVIHGETTVQLRISPASAPTVTTLPVVSIASTGAVLSGTINANGLRSSFWFEWGPTAGLGSTSRVRFIFGTSTATLTTNLAIQPPFPATLQPNTTYRYRFVAENESGTARGGEQTFVWSDASPRLDKPQRQPITGDLRLQFNGNLFQLYLIQSSTNLAEAWDDLGLGTNTSGNIFQYLHRRGGHDPSRLYRIQLP